MTQLAIMFLHVADLLSVSYLSVNDGISAGRTSSLLLYECALLVCVRFELFRLPFSNPVRHIRRS